MKILQKCYIILLFTGIITLSSLIYWNAEDQLIIWNKVEIWNNSMDRQIVQERKFFERIKNENFVEEVILCVVLCKASKEDIKILQTRRRVTDIDRQIQQAKVMLKSAAALTNSSLRFLIVTDSKKLFQNIVDLTSDWPAEYRQKVTFEYHEARYPQGRENMRNMFRVCVTEKLFLADLLQGVNALIAIDTDMIFMQPPEMLWQEFKKFNNLQLFAMAPCLGHYGSPKSKKVPFYGITGLNGGVMFMNLTRMRNFVGGWSNYALRVYDNYKDVITLAEQDILNIAFSKRPDLLYELSCHWNYRPSLCWDGWNKCTLAFQYGVGIMHGNNAQFIKNKEAIFRITFQIWEEYKLGTAMKQFYETLVDSLNHARNDSRCTATPQIKQIVTMGMKSWLLDDPRKKFLITLNGDALRLPTQ